MIFCMHRQPRITDKSWKAFFLLINVYAGFFFIALSFSVHAQSSRQISTGKVYMPAGLEGRVEFWKLIFTKYGKDHRVFHNRSYPEVIYSVIDFSEYEAKLSGKALLNAKLRELDKEKEKIKTTLQHLAGGNKPRNDFERRIDHLYSGLKGNKRALMREGAADEKIRYQTGIKERFHDGLVRSGRYLRAIEHIFAEEGLPPELGRLPLVESSFDYTANSSVGAAGIWQFMPATAKRYMKMNNYLDERRDPIIATRAAAKYLKNSYQNLNDWPLAVTSYNHGLSGVMRAVKQVGSINLVDIIQRYQSKSFGFASGNFYAEFLAALEVEQNAEKYFPGLVREQAIEFEEILLSRAIKFADLRAASRADDAILTELNRGFKAPIIRNQVFIPSGTYVKVPYGAGSNFISRITGSKIVAKSSEFKPHLYLADTRFATYESSIQQKQDLPAAIDLGSELGPPRLAATSEAVTEPLAQSYKVQSGDTLIGLSKRYGVSVQDIMRANGFSGANDLKAGRTIEIPGKSGYASSARVSTGASVRSSPPSTHIVQKGETLSGISVRYGIPLNELMAANGFSSGTDLKAGASIRIPSGGTHVRAASVNPRTYKVQRGDTIIGISRKYNTSVQELMRINGFSSGKDLKAGSQIKIPG
jgi:membrane-bound lytic murein transglycosylase D